MVLRQAAMNQLVVHLQQEIVTLLRSETIKGDLGVSENSDL